MPLDQDTLIQISSALVVKWGFLAAAGVGALALAWIALSRPGL